MGVVERSRPADDPASDEPDKGSGARNHDREVPGAPKLVRGHDSRHPRGDGVAVRQRIEEVGLTTERVPVSDPRARQLLEEQHDDIMSRHRGDRFRGLRARHQQVHDQRLKSEPSEDEVYLLVKVDDLVLGGIGLSRYEGPLLGEPPLQEHRVGEVFGVYTRPWARGNRVFGHGLRTVMAEARRADFTALYLRTGPKQQPAIEIYRRCGFRADAALDYNPVADGGLPGASPEQARAIGMYLEVPKPP